MQDITPVSISSHMLLPVVYVYMCVCVCLCTHTHTYIYNDNVRMMLANASPSGHSVLWTPGSKHNKVYITINCII